MTLIGRAFLNRRVRKGEPLDTRESITRAAVGSIKSTSNLSFVAALCLNVFTSMEVAL